MLGLYVDYSSSAVKHIFLQYGRHICSGAYASNVKLGISATLLTLLIAVSLL